MGIVLQTQIEFDSEERLNRYTAFVRREIGITLKSRAIVKSWKNRDHDGKPMLHKRTCDCKFCVQQKELFERKMANIQNC